MGISYVSNVIFSHVSDTAEPKINQSARVVEKSRKPYGLRAGHLEGKDRQHIGQLACISSIAAHSLLSQERWEGLASFA